MAFQGALTPEQVRDDPRQQIKGWRREHDFAVCIDTDGCALDNMWAKQVLVFQPLFVQFNGLHDCQMHFRIHAEHHNLWGKTRGCDRFLAVLSTLRSLLEDEQARRDMPVERVQRLADSIGGYVEFVESSNGAKAFGIPSLTEYHESHGRDYNITRLLAWSEAVNRSFRYFTLSMSPFDGVRETLEHISQKADVLVVSATPYCDLIEWWKGQDLARYVQAIAGKEMGKKADHIRLLKECAGYKDDQVIMVGDGGGDLKAARANNAMFYPTPAGKEKEAWANARESFEAFFAGGYRGALEDGKVAEFEDILLEKGPWELEGYDARAQYLILQDKRIATYRELHPEGDLFTL
jgi:phosphoglycolate phosphatase-like HAD superfamily hydrolase